jgi:hypothetical protein
VSLFVYVRPPEAAPALHVVVAAAGVYVAARAQPKASRRRVAAVSSLQHAMQALSTSLRGSLIRSESIGHALTKGEVREEDVADALRPHLPSRFTMSSGVVVNARGEESSQQDILITDSSISPPFLTAGRLGLHPAETIAAALEVKSTLTSTTLEAAIQSGASVKRTCLPAAQQMYWHEAELDNFVRAPARPGEPADVLEKPFTGVVALQAETSAEALLDRFARLNAELDMIDRTNCLVVLDKFVVVWTSTHDAYSIQPWPQRAPAVRAFPLLGDSFLYFYAMLFEALRRYVMPELDLLSYLAAAKVESRGKSISRAVPVASETELDIS